MRCRTAGSSVKRTSCWISSLAAVVGRVRLAGDDDLHGPVGVGQQRRSAGPGRAASA